MEYQPKGKKIKKFAIEEFVIVLPKKNVFLNCTFFYADKTSL